MSEPVTRLKRPVAVATVPAETVAERVRRLQSEAKSLAQDHVRALINALGDMEEMAAAIAEGGDAYPAGVRDLARRIAEDCEARAQTMEAIVGRAA